MPLLFISHTGADDDFVTETAARFNSADIEVWVDHLGRVDPGDDLYCKVQEGLNDCDMTLVVLSNISAQKPLVRNECLQTQRLGKRLYVVLKEDICPKVFPWFLNVIAYVDLSANLDDGFEQLITAMHSNRGLDLESDCVAVKRLLTSRQAIDPRLHVDLSGREDDVVNLLNLLNKGRPTFITGIGGIGKSRLAYEVAIQSSCEDGVIWHKCSDVSSPGDIVELLKQHLHLPLQIPINNLMDRLQSRKLLIVVDNAESLQESGQRAGYIDLANQLSQAGLQVLITSRETWNEFAITEKYSPQELGIEPAVGVVNAICEVEDVALTHEQMRDLAANSFRHPRLTELAVTLCKRRGFQRASRALEELRGRTVEDALYEMILQTAAMMKESDSKYGLMAENTLKRLNVCRGSFTYEAAKAISIDADSNVLPQDEIELDEVLDVLQRWNFVRWSYANERYSIDTLVIAVVRENEVVYDSHYRFYKRHVMEHTTIDDFHSLEPDIENLTAAFERKLAQGYIRDAFFICQNCVRLFFNRMRFDEWQDWLARVQPHIEEEGNDELMAHLSEALGDSHAHTLLGNRSENLKCAISHYGNALEFFTTERLVSKCVALLHNLAHVYQMLFESEQIVEYLRYAVRLYGDALENIDPAHSAPTWNNLGLCYFQIGQLESDASSLNTAIKFFEKAIQISSDRGSELRLANSLNSLANTYVALAQHQDFVDNIGYAQITYQDALGLATPNTDPMAYSLTCFNRGKLYRELAIRDISSIYMDKAIADFENALENCSAQYAPDQRGKILHSLGVAKFNLGFADVAIDLWTEAKDCFENASNTKLSEMIQDLISRAENLE